MHCRLAPFQPIHGVPDFNEYNLAVFSLPGPTPGVFADMSKASGWPCESGNREVIWNHRQPKHVTLSFSTFKKHIQKITVQTLAWNSCFDQYSSWKWCSSFPSDYTAGLQRCESLHQLHQANYDKKGCHQSRADTGDNFDEKKGLVSRGTMLCFSCSIGGGQGGTRNAQRSFQMQTEFPCLLVFAAGPKSQELTPRLKQLWRKSLFKFVMT